MGRTRADGAAVLPQDVVERGQVFSMELDAEDAMNNLRAFATAMGLVVAKPL